MRRSTGCVLLVVLLASGCGKGSTAYWIEQLKSPDDGMRLKAVRTLPERRADAAQVVPALIEALNDKEPDIRRGAAFGLGTFGDQGKEAVPALVARLSDKDTGVRKAAGTSLKLIDPDAARKAGVK